ncbi:MAG: hypothetical protein ACREA3_02145 [Nitrosotalea sp.]
MESVNTTDSLAIPDEDRKAVRSDVGKKLTYDTEEKTTSTKHKQEKPTKKYNLLSNQDIRRWYDNLARSSLVTAEVRLRKLGKFCENNKITPMELVELGHKDPKAIANLLDDTITTMEKNGNAPQYIKAIITSVKSWLEHHDIEVRRRMRITDVDSTPTLASEQVPNATELAELLTRADLRASAIMSLIGKAGLRPEVLGTFDATDGLMLKDLPDLEIVEGVARFSKVPARIMVRKTLSKAGHSYFTFITEGGTKKILAYLNERVMEGEVLSPESSLIAPLRKYEVFRGKNNGSKFLSTARIGSDVRDAMRPRFKWRPYVLRAYFDTQLLIAESRGKIAHDFRVFFMGHTGSIEAKYTTNKSILPVELITEMYEAFKRSQELLDLEKDVPQDAIASKQMVVTPEETEQLLREGWQFLGTLPNGKVVVKR